MISCASFFSTFTVSLREFHRIFKRVLKVFNKINVQYVSEVLKDTVAGYYKKPVCIFVLSGKIVY